MLMIYIIIAIYKGDVFTGCMSKPAISCRGKTTVFFVNYFYAFIFLNVGITYCSASVCRTIIYQKYFKICISLRNDRSYAF